MGVTVLAGASGFLGLALLEQLPATGRPVRQLVRPAAGTGQFASDITASQRVVPTALLEDGFTFTSPTIADGAEHLLG